MCHKPNKPSHCQRRQEECRQFEDGCLIVCSVTFQDTFCTLLSRTTTTHLEEREAELELQRLEKKDEPGEAASERWQQVLSCHMHKKFTSVCLQHVCLSDKGMFFFAGVGRPSRWTAAAATAQRSQPPAQRACAQRASAWPPGGAAITRPTNSRQ